MARRRRIYPVLLLPVGLPVEEEVLGEAFDVTIGGVDVGLTFPIHSSRSGFPSDWPRLGAPPGANEDVHDRLVEYFSPEQRWGKGFNASWEVWALAASMLAAPGQDLQDTPEVEALRVALDRWVLRTREWILAHHRMPRPAPTEFRGPVIVGVTPEGTKWSTLVLIGSVLIAGRRGGSIAEVRAAFQHATAGENPPLQYRLLIDAKTEAVEGDRRRAVLDAGTAAEISLAEAIRDQLGGTGVSNSDTVEAIIAQANGLIGLIDLFTAAGGSLAVSKGKASDLLAGKRNTAAHSGRTPTQSETSAAIQCADDIIASATPFSFPY